MCACVKQCVKKRHLTDQEQIRSVFFPEKETSSRKIAKSKDVNEDRWEEERKRGRDEKGGEKERGERK